MQPLHAFMLPQTQQSSRQRLYLVIAPHPTAQGQLFELAAALAARGPLRVLDGGNCFNVYPVAQALRRLASPNGGGGFYGAMERLKISRAFTCYQMLSLLERTPSAVEPVLVLDLLSTFHDENVPERERKRLLRACLPHLQRLCQAAPVLVSTRPNADPELLELLEQAAGQVWRAETPLPLPAKRLFEA